MNTNVNTGSTVTNKTKDLPPIHHRDVEHLKEELQAIHRLFRVCVDSMQLANVLELTHTTEVLDELAERTWSAIKPAEELQDVLWKKWLVEIKTKEAEAEILRNEQALAEIPTEVIKAFEGVRAAYKASKKTGGEQS